VFCDLDVDRAFIRRIDPAPPTGYHFFWKAVLSLSSDRPAAAAASPYPGSGDHNM
jgi:hypothetical protein